jgi:hypothetical protein
MTAFCTQAPTDSLDVDDLESRRDGALIDGRPITNVEMSALTRHKRSQRRERISQRDCDDCVGPMADGGCRKLCGRCVFFEDANRMLWGVTHGSEAKDDSI